MNKKNKIILCSGSPRRRELMKLLKVPFTVHPVKINENIDIKKPEKLVMKLAFLKASAGKKCFSAGLAVGADTIVVNKKQR